MLTLVSLSFPAASQAQGSCSGFTYSCDADNNEVMCACGDDYACSDDADCTDNPYCNFYTPRVYVAGLWRAKCCSRTPTPGQVCDSNSLPSNSCSGDCATPPPDCEDGECSCGPGGVPLPTLGDPVHSVTGESILVETDLRLNNNVSPVTLRRHYTSSNRTWLMEDLVRSVPKPFGASVAQRDTLNWWHEHYSFVHVSTSRWVAVKGTGAVTRFTPCTGTPCSATPETSSASKRERLQRTATGFVLTDMDGRKLHFESKHVESGGSQERYFLSRILSPSGTQEAALTYSVPSGLTCPAGNTGTAAGVPYLASVGTASGALDFQYAQLTSVLGASECVVRSVTRRGESVPAVTYSYKQDSGSVERPGLIAQASLGSKVLTYGYSSTALESSVGSLLVTRHDYATDGTVTSDTSAGGQLNLGALVATTCQPGSDCCGVQPQARPTTDVTAGRGDGLTGAPGFVRTYETLSNTSQTTSPRLYQTTDACSVTGACSPGTDRYEWVCAAGSVPAHEKARKNKRDFWEVYTHASPAVGTGIPASILEKTNVKRGAVDMTGTGALEEETFSYTYGPNGEQLLATAEKPSVLGAAGQKARTFNRYDSSGRLAATIRSGWTRVFNASTGVWSSQQRWVGTFFLTTRTGESTADALNRTLEKHGPCLVANEAATDCPSGTPFAITRTYYWPDTETTPRRNQLQKVATYPAGLSSTPIETFYNVYDASGHVTESVDANGVTTLSSYQDDQLLTSTVRVTGQPDVVTTYGYDSAGHQQYVLYPEGNYEVSCYRQGTTSGCSGGTLTDKLQWKAKSSTATATTWSEKLTYTYWPDGTVNEERYLDASGTTRKLLSYAADAHRRQTREKVGTGAGSFTSARSHDGAGSITGKSFAFNSPPAWCAAGTDGQPTSTACTSLQYDGANRLLSVDEHPTSSSTTRTCVKHDVHGNVISVDKGLAATTNCATATPSANASRYQYDDFGQLVEATQAANGAGITAGTTRFTHDAVGNLLVKQTPAMSASSVRAHLAYTYDSMSRQLSAAHHSPLVSGGSEGLYALAYDTTAPLPSSCGTLANTLGRPLYRNDSFGRTWFSYDAWGRLVKEVRLRTGTTICSPSTPFQNPHTLYAYSLNGNLTQVTHPYGRTVTYTYGIGALADRVSSVNVLTWGASSTSSSPLVSQVTWEPYGGLRGYRTHYATSATTGSIEYALGDNSSAAPSSCPSAPPSVTSGDATGRQRALWVSTLASGVNFTPGSGNGSVLKQLYTWQADQLIRTDTCLLGTSSPRTETYGYDGQLRLTGGTGTLTTQGGPFATRAFSHDNRGNRITESGEANTWTLDYSNLGHPDQLTSRYSNQAGSQLGYSYFYDADGRVSSKQWHAGPYSSAFTLTFSSGPSSSGATDSVFKSVNVEGLTYNYFYDGTGKRRLKDYPTGIKDEYFYNATKGLLVDQGNSSTFSASTHPVDEYVWLDGRPIAVIRGKLDASWAHLSDATADCKRLDEAASCGIYHLVTDYLGKPVLMLDSQGRVTGTGEYDAFGHVNRVSVDIESPHPYTTSTGVVGAVMKQPAVAGTTLSQRVLIDSLDLWRDADNCPTAPVPDHMDNLNIKDVASSGRLTYIDPYYAGRMWTEWVIPGASGIQAAIDNSAFSHCSQSQDCSGIQCVFTCTCTPAAPNVAKPYTGVVISAYEYRRVQTGASYFWTPLRLPGQYHDTETDLFENWNRFYDPNAGRYLQPEPLAAPDPTMATEPAYAYARSNPVKFEDPTGLFIKDPKFSCPNWSAALQIAKHWAGCDPTGTRKSCKCQMEMKKQKMCDICPFLENGRLPYVFFEDWNMFQTDGLTSVPRDTVRLKAKFCENSWFSSNTEYLAQLMIHEAMHYCERVTGIPVDDDLSWGASSGANNVAEYCRDADGT
ncbi:RHS repeat-associated core domain-containing protein [Myxococcus qinghaiensis]|uniref:RHS repeat-associated core domain-containing protein n=1 Tax=Myxococcus qinghaiensis TaxID=2906758 RepID=UPI0020A72C76|nr:RHS repeat-associated core domain-containing protein [Myxococcus qinghaiensis]MCP3161428.1 DUF6531 domain-containing protein [Myxococcus qinghaiensis]